MLSCALSDPLKNQKRENFIWNASSSHKIQNDFEIKSVSQKIAILTPIFSRHDLFFRMDDDPATLWTGKIFRPSKGYSKRLYSGVVLTIG